MSANWQNTDSSISHSSMRAPLLSLQVYFPNEAMAESVSLTWAALSRACHCHPYEFPPTPNELGRHLRVAAQFTEAVA